MVKKILNFVQEHRYLKKGWVVTLLAIFFAVGSIAVSVAASGISFTDAVPVESSTTPSAKPSIGAKVTVTDGPLDSGDITMTVDDKAVLPNLTADATPNTYKVSYTPTENLSNGLHNVKLSIFDPVLEREEFLEWPFYVDAAPNLISFAPNSSQSGPIDNTSVKISALIRDTYDTLNVSSLILKVNGVKVTPRFTYAGHWESDSCSSFYVIDSYQEGNLEYTAANLKDGVHKVELSIADSKGNLLTKNWEFIVGAKPRFAAANPANGTLINNGTGVSAISLQVMDDTAVNPESIDVKVNGTTTDHNFDPGTGLITVAGNFNEGTYKVEATAADNSGNQGTTAWSFTVSSDLKPVINPVSPADGESVRTASPKITATVKDTFDKLNATTVELSVDGNKVTPYFSFKGHTVYDSCGGSYYVIDSYQEGTISYQTANLTEGIHTAKLTIADEKGYSATREWSFTVGTPPKFSNLTPAANSQVGSGVQVSATVTDENGVNWDSVVVRVNGDMVTYKLDTVNHRVYYNGSLPEGSVTITVEAQDTRGNPGSVSWTFDKDSKAPEASNWTPTKDGKITVHNPAVSAYFIDVDELDPNSVQAFIDNKSVNAKFEYKGYWQTWYDSCTGYMKSYIVQSRKEGTVSFDTTGLKDGVHKAKIILSDIRGNRVEETWSFVVGRAPTFSQFTPADNSEQGVVKRVSAVVEDDVDIDWNSVVMKVNNNIVQHQLDIVGQIVYYEGNFPTGKYDVELQVSDGAANIGIGQWSFLADTTPPSVKFLLYRGGKTADFASGLKLTNSNFSGNLVFGADVRDLVKIRRQVISTMEGVETKSGTMVNKPLDINIRFRGYTDSCNGQYIETYDNEGYFGYEGPIKDGNYTVTLNLADYLGNDVTYVTNFTVESAPVITDLAPLQYGLTDFTPMISAKVKDWNGTIVPGTIRLTLNGEMVQHNYDETTGLVSYTPVEPLENESYHTVTIYAEDDQGLSTTKTWKFYINTYPDMADSNISNCTSCHSVPTYSGYNGDFERIHARKISFGGTHSSNDCDDCHGYITAYADCYQCHGLDEEPATWDLRGHGDTPGIKYRAANTDPYMPIRVIENREMWDCVICHQPGARTLGYIGARSQPTEPLNNHDIPELHKAPASNCSECHARSLSREHAREGRVDTEGNPITCNTCHRSTNATVTDAIQSGNTRCTACHVEADHDAVHQADDKALDSNCQVCHKAYLTKEHLNKQTHLAEYRDNLETNYDCDTCHASAQTSVTRAITANNLSCAACHDQGHNLNFVEKVPDSILLHKSFKWTTLMETALFEGEPGFPQGYEKGQVVQSSRNTSITPDKVWTDYFNELELKGWVLKSPVPADKTSGFKAEFERDGRLLLVQCYTTATRGGGDSLGTKIELWYR